MANSGASKGFKHLTPVGSQSCKAYNNTASIGIGDPVYEGGSGYIQRADATTATGVQVIGHVTAILDADGLPKVYMPASTTNATATPWTISVASWNFGDRLVTYSADAVAFADIGLVRGVSVANCNTTTGNSNFGFDMDNTTGNSLRLDGLSGRLGADAWGANAELLVSVVSSKNCNATTI